MERNDQGVQRGSERIGMIKRSKGVHGEYGVDGVCNGSLGLVTGSIC